MVCCGDDAPMVGSHCGLGDLDERVDNVSCVDAIQVIVTSCGTLDEFGEASMLSNGRVGEAVEVAA